MEAILKQNREARVHVLVVWEPMLVTDWSRPGAMVQSRISDSRVAQFWDKDHLVAKSLDQQLSDSQRSCCRKNGILWDIAALFPENVHWGNSGPTFIDGPVGRIAARIQQGLLEANQRP
jgi:hypothetical protein